MKNNKPQFIIYLFSLNTRSNNKNSYSKKI